MLQNLHTHTILCDGKHSAEEMVLSAIKKGLKSLGFSGHRPIAEEFWCLKDEQAYIKEITRLKEKYIDELEIFLGIENEFICGETLYKYDYVISSVHCIEKNNKFLWVDATKDILKKDTKEFYNDDIYLYINEYYNNLVEASKSGDILGHFDLISKFNVNCNIFDENSKKYLEIAENTLIKCIKNNIIIEINTGAIERGYQTRFYPAPYLLNTLFENNGKIIVTSDAHNKDAIDFYYNETVDILKKYGFKTQMQLTKSGFVEIEL